MLSPVALNFSKLGKWLFWAAFQGAATERAVCLHATSEAEYQELRGEGISVPVAIIRNGVDLPVLGSFDRRSPEAKVSRTLLYFGRIHPKKGLDALIGAWSRVAEQWPNWRLRIVGPGDAAHVNDVNRMVAESNAVRVTIEKPVYGDAKWELFRRADLFVMPSYNENFGLTVAESLACRLPVITTKGTPWAGVETNGCGWWIETGEEALTAVLRTTLDTPDDVLEAMGWRGEAWVRQSFSWDVIGQEMVSVYRWAAGKGSRLSCVRLAE